MKKNILWIAALLLAVVFIAGTMFPQTTANRRIENAENVLQKKYGETFTITRDFGHELFKKYYTVYAHSNEYPNIPFSAKIDDDGDGSTDTYVDRRSNARISQQVDSIISKAGGSYYVDSRIGIPYLYCDDPEISVKDYMAMYPKLKFTVYIYYIAENLPKAEQVYEVLEETAKEIPELSGNFALYIMDAGTVSEVQDYVESHPILEGDWQKLTEPDLVGYVPMEQGTLGMSVEEFKEKMGA